MELTLQIAALASVVAFIILVIYAVSSLKSMSRMIDNAVKSLDKLTSDFTELKDKTIISLGTIDITAKQITTATQKIEEGANSIIAVAAPFQRLADNVYYKIAPPIIHLVTLISAVTKAVSVFTGVLTGKKEK
jgi:uncharacterized protein YoxC